MLINLKRILATKRTETFSLIVAPFLGFLAFLLPVLFKNDIELEEKGSTLVSLVSNTFESMVFLPTVGMLIVVGFMIGFAGGRFWWLCSILTIIFFPVVAIYEMLVSPESHNLWPFEFLLYGFLTTPAIFGSFIGSRIAQRIRKD